MSSFMKVGKMIVNKARFIYLFHRDELDKTYKIDYAKTSHFYLTY